MSKLSHFTLLFALACSSCASLDPQSGDTAAPASEAAADAASPSADEAAAMEAMMAAWQRAATPGPEHRALDAFVGTWNATVSMWWSPEGEPEVSNGTMVNAWMLDGHHLEQRYEGTAGGAPFSGRGTWGFDVAAGRYCGTWIDSMSTSVMISRGERSKDGKTFVSQSINTDPMTGEASRTEDVIVIESPDRHRMTSYRLEKGTRTKSMEIVYERAK